MRAEHTSMTWVARRWEMISYESVPLAGHRLSRAGNRQIAARRQGTRGSSATMMTWACLGKTFWVSMSCTWWSASALPSVSTSTW